MTKVLVGKITHYFDKLGVGILELSDSLSNNDLISVEGHGRAFEQNVASLQVNKEKIASAEKGMSVGLKFTEPVKPNDLVYKVID